MGTGESVTFVTDSNDLKYLSLHRKMRYFCQAPNVKLNVRYKILAFSVFLIATMLFNSLRISFTYLHYYVDPSGFIEKLCENKDKPELKCNGKCYLMKVLQQKEKDKQQKEEAIEYKELILYVEHSAEQVFLWANHNQETDLPIYRNFYSYLSSTSIHPPPQVLAA